MKRLILILLFTYSGSYAHEVRPAYLEIKEITPNTYSVLFKIPARGPDKRLSIYVRFPEDFEEVIAPKITFTGVAFLETITIRREKGIAGSFVQVEGLEATLTDILVRVEHLHGDEEIIRIKSGEPGFIIKGSPGKFDVSSTYLLLGIEHILGGLDHLLFILGLFMIVTGRWLLLKTVTGLTIAHSITLGLASIGFINIPQAPVEAIIALSIVFLAFELVRKESGTPTIMSKWPWLVAFIFGSLHGLGFAGALSEIGLPTFEIPLALFTFNVGVEIGQILFLAVLVGISIASKQIPGRYTKLVPRVTAYAMGSLAVFWVFERLQSFF